MKTYIEEGGITLTKILKKIRWIYKYTYTLLPRIASIIILGIVSSGFNIYKALILKNLIDSATTVQINSMLKFLILFGIIIILDLTIQSIISILSTGSYTKMYNNIEKNVYSNVLHKKWIELSKYHSGDISTRIISDGDSITNLMLNIIPAIISNIVLLVGSFATLLYFNVYLALILSLLSPILIIITRFCSTKLKKLYLQTQQIESIHRSLLNESIQNIVILKSFCAEKNNFNTLISIQKEKYRLTMAQNKINVINNSLFSLGSWLSFFIVFSWGAFNLLKKNTTFGTMSALIQLFGNIQYPLLTISSSLVKAIAATASIDRLMELEELHNDIKSNEFNIIGNLGFKFDDVSFSYKNDLPILNNITEKIHSGKTTAIIGSSGEGKTTFIRLLLSLIYPEKGHIYITVNKENFELNPFCRNLISYVPQGNTLFSGTIAENLRYGNENADDEELKTAAMITYAWDFIKTFKDGLNTAIGEHGLGLSEGQAQRLAITRALLKKSPILILDEATSALDMETELKVLKTIQNLEYKPTCLIITHRPSALAICDRVLKLENGSLFEVSNEFYKEIAVGNL